MVKEKISLLKSLKLITSSIYLNCSNFLMLPLQTILFTGAEEILMQ